MKWKDAIHPSIWSLYHLTSYEGNHHSKDGILNDAIVCFAFGQGGGCCCCRSH